MINQIWGLLLSEDESFYAFNTVPMDDKLKSVIGVHKYQLIEGLLYYAFKNEMDNLQDLNDIEINKQIN